MDVVALLNQHQALSLVWMALVWVCAIYLIVLGVMTFVRPALVRRFLEGYAASQRLNALEAGLRLLAGLAFMGASPAMHWSLAFFWFGVVLAASAIPMLFLYQTHKRYAVWAIPFAKRILPLYGVLALSLGGLVVWALS